MATAKIVATIRALIFPVRNIFRKYTLVAGDEQLSDSQVSTSRTNEKATASPPDLPWPADAHSEAKASRQMPHSHSQMRCLCCGLVNCGN